MTFGGVGMCPIRGIAITSNDSRAPDVSGVESAHTTITPSGYCIPIVCRPMLVLYISCDGAMQHCTVNDSRRYKCVVVAQTSILLVDYPTRAMSRSSDWVERSVVVTDGYIVVHINHSVRHIMM